MGYNFFILGGDLRNFLLASKLQEDGNNVKIFGFNNEDAIKRDLYNIDTTRNPIEENNLKRFKDLNELEDNDILIGAIPFTKDGINIYSPYSNENIPIDKLKKIENKKIKFFAGKIQQNLYNNVNWEIYDILKDEAQIILNTIPTAEGAIQIAMQKTNYTIDKSNVLVMGYGRVGKTLCLKLKKMNANVYAMARKEEDLAWIKVYGYNPIPKEEIKQNICKMDIIFNTIPNIILNKEILMLLNRDTLIIDLASAPGGVDYEAANKIKIQSILAGGLPGKVAAETTANYIKEYINKNVKKCNLKSY